MNYFKVIQRVVLFCLIGAALLLVFSKVPFIGDYKFMIVQSGSMEPSIKTGAVVMVNPVDNYKIGDIITFKKSERAITHRINDIEVREGKPYYITKGDANNTPDSKKVTNEEVIGKVLFDIPYFGYVINFIQTPLGFALAIIIPAVLIIMGEIRKIYLEIKNE